MSKGHAAEPRRPRPRLRGTVMKPILVTGNARGAGAAAARSPLRCRGSPTPLRGSGIVVAPWQTPRHWQSHCTGVQNGTCGASGVGVRPCGFLYAILFMLTNGFYRVLTGLICVNIRSMNDSTVSRLSPQPTCHPMAHIPADTRHPLVPSTRHGQSPVDR